MDPNDRQRVKILLILLAVLAASIWIGRQLYQVSSVAPASVVGGGMVSADGVDDSPVGVGLETDRDGAISVPPDEGRRNPFQYGPPPTPPVPADDGLSPVRRDIENTPPPREVVRIPAPPAPPPIPFQYNGYAVIDRSGEITAFLFDDDGYFAVSEGDVVTGRYRINAVTESFVEVEDLEYGSPERLPLIVQ